MIELLPLSIGIGLAVGMLFTELFGIASGGLIVPGYIALYITRPVDILVTIGVSLITFAIVRSLATFLIIYGRRRTALMILMGYIIGMLVRNYSGLTAVDFSVIGFIIPGLIAVWMDRQGVFQTLASLILVSSMVRFILIAALGAELLI
ncbi:MAG: poly-gamma-glutamate biosynthesis protein PgsC [Myxococcota bacterium]